MDKIIIRNLKLDTVVGVYPEEKKRKRRIIVNVQIFCGLRKAGLSDKLQDTVDYMSLKMGIISAVETKKYKLVEKIAEEIAGICLENKLIRKVIVSVDKPAALARSESVAVEIQRPLRRGTVR